MDERDAMLLLGLLPSRGERPHRRTADPDDELSLSDADCHLPRPQLDHARCNVAKNIMPQSAGL
jgi:hypothetical protein